MSQGLTRQVALPAGWMPVLDVETVENDADLRLLSGEGVLVRLTADGVLHVLCADVAVEPGSAWGGNEDQVAVTCA